VNAPVIAPKTSIVGYILRHEITTTISAMSGALAHKIKVLFKGDDARTDGSSYVTIPDIANGQLYPTHEAQVLRGYANHETAHVLYSKLHRLPPFVKRVFKTAFKDLTPNPDPRELWRYKLWKSLSNCVEDWRT
jgi:hypothetical protein